MTQISPRRRQDAAIHFARMHRAQDIRALRHAATEITCAIGLVILAAAAGYLARAPETCAALTAALVDFN